MSESDHYAAMISTWLQGFEIDADYLPGQGDKLREKIHEITSLLARRVVGEASKKSLDGSVIVKFNRDTDKKLIILINLLIEEVKHAAFMKGVKHGTTIRNINWNTENHRRHGRKMEKAKENAANQERKRIRQKLQHSGGVMDVLWITEEDWQALEEGK